MSALGSKLRIGDHGGVAAAFFKCPGCNEVHMVTIRGANTWGFNENGDRPTFTPSVLVTGTQRLSDEAHAAWMARKAPLPPPVPMVCHSFVTDGRIQFLGDCTHALAGKTVDLPDWGAL